MKIPVPKDLSEVILLAANSLPVLGVLFWGWDAFSVMAVFWLENVVIGVINVLKMGAAMFVQKAWSGIVVIPFFCFHYGMFTMVHGIFVFALFGHGHEHMKGLLDKDDFRQILAVPELAWALGGLALSHLFSFFFNFIGQGEVRRDSMNVLMGKPYGRVVMLHITLIFGGIATQALHSPIWAVLLLTVLKTIGDLILHQRSHQGLSNPQGAGYNPQSPTTSKGD